MELGEMKVGQKGRIKSFEKADILYRRKLLAMGLTLNTPIEVKRIAPLGDPVEVIVRESAVTLRKHEAAFINIELES